MIICLKRRRIKPSPKRAWHCKVIQANEMECRLTSTLNQSFQGLSYESHHFFVKAKIIAPRLADGKSEKIQPKTKLDYLSACFSLTVMFLLYVHLRLSQNCGEKHTHILLYNYVPILYHAWFVKIHWSLIATINNNRFKHWVVCNNHYSYAWNLWKYFLQKWVNSG